MPDARIASVLRRLALPAAALCALAAPVAAQQPTQAQRNAIRQSCAADYRANCSSVPTGGMASLQCLQQHMSSLSPACQSAVDAVSGGATGGAAGGAGSPAIGAPGGAMGDGAMPGAPATGGRPPGAPPREEIALIRAECRRDFRTYCPDAPLGGGKAAACLERNETRLSPGCRGALAEFFSPR
jgi:hypothetical protein